MGTAVSNLYHMVTLIKISVKSHGMSFQTFIKMIAEAHGCQHGSKTLGCYLLEDNLRSSTKIVANHMILQGEPNR